MKRKKGNEKDDEMRKIEKRRRRERDYLRADIPRCSLEERKVLVRVPYRQQRPLKESVGR